MDPRYDQEGVEPEVDLFESDDAFLLRAALPGVQPQDIHLEATGRRIFLSAESSALSAASQDQPPPIRHRKGHFSRGARFQFTTILPFEINPDAAQARYKNGMLTLRLPKRQAEEHRRVPIPIQAGEMEAQSAPSGAPATPSPAPANTSSAPPPPEERSHEGRPAAKMGMAYTPTGSEDHTTKAQSLTQQQAQPSRTPQTNGVTSAVTTGQTNPLEPPPPQPANPKT
ncbi:MAG TPA: Hsp20/alpha crystallin family protein [Chthonomonadaceae bacterium]|nr:Hsp20/alpha crystallin family protein [Chthonomonadaceae bacterium]